MKQILLNFISKKKKCKLTTKDAKKKKKAATQTIIEIFNYDLKASADNPVILVIQLKLIGLFMHELLKIF